MTPKARREVDGLPSLDDFLKEEGLRDQFEAVAIKEVLAWRQSNQSVAMSSKVSSLRKQGPNS